MELKELHAGDIGAVAKLNVTQTGDTLAVRTAPIVYHKPQISTPYTYMRYNISIISIINGKGKLGKT